MPTVLLVGNFLSATRGIKQVIEEQADQLNAVGWPVITTSNHHVRVTRLLDMLNTTWAARMQFDIALVDVFSGPSFVWAEAVTWLLNRLGKPYILNLHCGLLPEFARRSPQRVQRMLRAANRVVTPSQYLKGELDIFRNDISIIRNGIDLAAYRFNLRTQACPRVAWLRAFNQVYRPEIVPDIVARLVTDFPDIKLTMFGSEKRDDSKQRTLQVAHQLGVADRIRLPGSVPKTEVPEALAAFDIFLNTTTAESFGVSVLEAAALGMVIVTTNAGELAYLWENEKDALLVPPNDAEAMAAAVRRVLTEPGLAARLSQNARAKAEQLSWDRIMPQWHALFREMAATTWKKA